jgi:transcription elongation factor Elf1
MTCPLCNIANLVTISMVVNERKLTLNSCGRCETRWWQADERNVTFGTVLDSARRPLEAAV